MKTIEYYKPNIEEVVKKVKANYQAALNGKVGHVGFLSMSNAMHVGGKLDLTHYNGFDNEEDIDRFIDHSLQLYHQSFEMKRHLKDLEIPNVSIHIGIGDFSAFVDGEIEFQPDTSWSPHPLEGRPIAEYKDFPPLGTAKWYKRYLLMAEKLIAKVAPMGIPFSRAYFSPLDLAYALRGNDIYFDYYDQPDALKELLDYCVEATIHFGESILDLMRKYYKDSKYGMSLMDGYVNMSEDGACMISPDLYREFGAPYAQKVIDHFGKGQMHCHSRAMYLVKEICSLNNVVSLWLPTDPNQTRPIEHIPSVVEDAGSVMVAIDAENMDEVLNQLDTLKTGNFSVYVHAEDETIAQENVDRFNKAYNDFN